MREHAKWVLCGLLFLATFLNYLDRQTMSVTSTEIAAEMALSDADLGRLFSAFYLSYGLAQILLGAFLDRLSIVLAFALAVGAWSLAGAAAALATGFWSLFWLRALLGVCESPNWPLALRIVARTFPPGQRAFASGTFQCGTSVGAVLASPIIIYLTARYNWRVTFLVCGLVGLFWVALWLLWFRYQSATGLNLSETASTLCIPVRKTKACDRVHGSSPPQEPSPRAEDRTASDAELSPSSFRDILGSRALWGMLVSTCFLNPLQYLYFSWLPRYFQHYVGVEFGKELSSRLVLAYLAYDVGLVLAGTLVAYLARSWGSVRARLVVGAGGALCMTSIPMVSSFRDIDIITSIICLATFGLGVCIVNYLAFTAEVSAKKVSTAAGILGGAGSLAGSAFMLLVGDSVDKSGGFAFVFALAAVMPLISWAGMCFSTTRRPAA